MLDQVFRSLLESTKHIKGANVENNKFCVSVHYRNVDEKVRVILSTRVELDISNSFFVPNNNGFVFMCFFGLFQYWTTIAQCVETTLKDYPCLRLTHGRKVCLNDGLQTYLISKLVLFCLSSYKTFALFSTISGFRGSACA